METANDQFKRGFSDWFWLGLIAATVLHAAIFFAYPTFGIQDYAFASEELRSVDLPEEIEIPAPPEAVARPAKPVITETRVDEDVTMPLTTIESSPIDLPPPPTGDGRDLDDVPKITPMTIQPRLQNQREMARALERYYPPLLRDAGIGGTVNMWFFIDEEGRVVKTQINQSSGYDALDEAAGKVANLMEFSPAYNRDQKVPVWVAIDITFEVQ